MENSFEITQADGELLSRISSRLIKSGIDLSQYEDKPIEFVKEVLKMDLWAQQTDIIKSTIDNRYTVVEAGHGVGKCCQHYENLYLADGSVIPAGSMIGKEFDILGFDPSNWQMRPMRAYATDNGIAPCSEVVTTTGRRAKRTTNHPLLTHKGWVAIDALRVGTEIAVPCGDPRVNWRTTWDTITKISDIGEQPTVAISVPETQAYVTTVIDHNSVVSAMITCWWLSCHDEGVVITLAPTFSQVNAIIWRYVRHLGLKAKLPGTIFETPRWDIAPNRYAVGLSPRKASREDMATLQGYHNKNLLVIMDEAAGLPRVMFEGIISLCVSENNRVLAIGNPIEKSGPFYDACNSETWHHIRISCLDHPNVKQGVDIIPGAVSRKWVDEMVRDHCTLYRDPLLPIEITGGMDDEELQKFAPPDAIVWNKAIYIPGPVFQAKVLGVPPDEGSSQLISLAWVESAKRWDAEGDIGHEKIIGFDPARYGGDYATMVYRQGKKVHWIRRRRPITRNPSDELAGWLQSEVERTGPDTWCLIDEIGIGAGVVDASRRLGLNVKGIGFGKRARQHKRFANTRAEAYWRVREKLQVGELALPNDDLLTGDLIAPRYSYDNLGRLLIEDKDDIKARIGRSPDSGDALALTFGLPALDAGDIDPDSRQEVVEPVESRWFMVEKSTKGRWHNPARLHRR